MKTPKCHLGVSLVTFGAGLLLSCILPPFALICLLSLIITATGLLLWKR